MGVENVRIFVQLAQFPRKVRGMSEMSMVAISGIAIAVSMAVFFFLAMKQVGPVVSAIICTIIVGIFADGGLINALFTTFTNGLGNFLAGIFLCFAASFMLSALMTDSGLGASLGNFLVAKMGVKAAPYVILILSAILGYMGILAWMFIVAPIAIAILRAANLPRDVCCIATAAGGGCLMCLCPGAVTAINAMPTEALGTTLYAAPGFSIILIVVFMTLSILYMEWYLRKCKREGRHFTEIEGKAPVAREGKEPHVIKTVIVLVVVIALVAILQIHIGLGSFTAVAIAQVIGCLLVVALCHKEIGKKNWFNYVRDSVAESYGPVLMMSSVVAYAGVVATTSFFSWLSGMLETVNMNPYVVTVIVAVLFALLSADAAGGTSTFSQLFAGKVLAMGGNAQIIHRLAICASTTLDSMPHNSALILQMSIVGCTHKEAYKHFVMVQIVCTGITTLVGLIIACVFF